MALVTLEGEVETLGERVSDGFGRMTQPVRDATDTEFARGLGWASIGIGLTELGEPEETGEKGIRAYFEANGKFQLDPLWSITGSTRIASDKTVTRRYDLTRDDRLRTGVGGGLRRLCHRENAALTNDDAMIETGSSTFWR